MEGTTPSQVYCFRVNLIWRARVCPEGCLLFVADGGGVLTYLVLAVVVGAVAVVVVVVVVVVVLPEAKTGDK